jgi:nucleoside-diphosphate-sugar epimerase
MVLTAPAMAFPGARHLDRTIVVTGASGFVGTALCAHLRAAGRRFRGLTRGAAPPGHGRSQYLSIGDLAQAPEDALAHALEGAGAIVHLAARAHMARERSADAGRAYREANVVATERLARAAAAAGVPRFVFVSSIKVNGEATLPGAPFRESDVPRPEDAYGRTKWEAEQKLATIAGEARFALSVLRPPLVYGPQLRGNFLTLWRAVAHGLPLPFARIANRRSLLFVGNLVHAIVALVDAPVYDGGTWLVADREAVSTPELVQRIAAALGVTARLVPLPVRVLEAGAAVVGRRSLVRRIAGSLEIDARALAERIGPLPFTLDEGLAATARWWRRRQ